MVITELVVNGVNLNIVYLIIINSGVIEKEINNIQNGNHIENAGSEINKDSEKLKLQ